MNFLGLLVVPALFWAAYHYYKDRHKPEPVQNLLLTYGLGVAAGLVGLHAYSALELVGLRHDAYQLALTDRPGLLLYSILVIGVTEEAVKFIPFWLVGMRLRAFDEPIDGVIYASFVALGYATYENFHYLETLDGYPALGRAIASPLVHTMFSSIWGYACGRARMRRQPLLPAAVMGLAMAALVHGLYDFVAIGLSEWVRLAPPVIILIIWTWRMYLIRRLHQAHRGSADRR